MFWRDGQGVQTPVRIFAIFVGNRFTAEAL